MLRTVAWCFGLGLAVIVTAAGEVAGIATAPHALQIFVTDLNNHHIVRINDMTGVGWITLGSFGKSKYQFNNPRGITVTAAGQIFVTDAGNSRIVRINDMTGAGWTTFGTEDRGVNQFDLSGGITVR